MASIVLSVNGKMVGDADKPTHFGQAAKDCIATLYAPVDQITVVSTRRVTDRSGHRATQTSFVEYHRDVNGGWNKGRATTRRMR